MDVKMMLCDMDGTLFTSEKTITPRTIKAIEAIRKQGILFGIATGRAGSFITQFFQSLHLDHLIDVVVATGGGEIIDHTLDIHETTYYLTSDACKAIMRHFDDLPVVYGVTRDDYLVVSEASSIIDHVTSINKYPTVVEDFDKLTDHDQPKLCVFCMEENLDMIEAHAKRFPERDYNCYYVRSGPYLVEYADVHVTKDQGIAKLLGYHHMTKDNLMAFGDADNDYSMIQYARYGIVMANGSEKTKSVAYAVTCDNDHDGIADYLEKYVIKETMR